MSESSLEERLERIESVIQRALPFIEAMEALRDDSAKEEAAKQAAIQQARLTLPTPEEGRARVIALWKEEAPTGRVAQAVDYAVSLGFNRESAPLFLLGSAEAAGRAVYYHLRLCRGE